ncbi:TrbI/VirB10 family protein [Caulobacter vibrioides]|uniref:type IV secretion system protein VirB10 n=1 Tax=Caulobacter vibrioides TaxID=155892 RepID=UPI000BB4D6D3|nr:type IV secretion system protein VirB10 [Caulobacter vibrioides]ATC25414.1 type VI secretion protein [Caulobacter vibrioides]AZH13506.1 TrbI/VirB10 family protein [Caulobacter vibrioides]PLR14373.1 type VI secretion protein [Caulobacter vibrioides]
MTAPSPPSDPHLDSPVLRPLGYGPTAVSRPQSPWGLALGIVAIIILGMVVYASLSQAREAAQRPPTPPPALAAETAPPSPAASIPAIAVADSGAMQQGLPSPDGLPEGPLTPQTDTAAQEATTRLRAPAMVVDLDSRPAPDGDVRVAATIGAEPAPTRAAPRPPADDSKISAEERFAEKVAGANADAARATRLTDPSLVAPQGTVIPAILETAINSDLPGFVRAVVSRDVRGFDGSTVLIPRGSKLIGQYKSGVAAGQTRAFIVWSRVLTPQGVSIDIASPGADRLGRGGLDGETNTHFFRRFGASILLSVLNAGLNAASNNGNGGDNTAIIIGSPQQASNIASIALQREIDIPTTITVAQGAPIRVFVARDLDFSGVVQKTR